MNTTALAVIQADELETIQRTAKLLAASGYFGTSQDGIVGMAQVAAKILAGREMGFGPFASVNGVHIIQGKPAVGANLMASAVKSSGRYDYRVLELTNTVCKIEYRQRNGDKWEVIGVSEFTAEDARKAQTKNMDKFPKNMLFARAMSNGVRWYVPDIFSGNAVYVPEELGADVDGEGNVIEVQGQRIEVATGEIVDAPTDDKLAALKEERRRIEMSDLEHNHEKQELAHIDAVIAKIEGDDPATQHELNIISQWQGPTDAQNWAMMTGACENAHHAKQSWMNVVKECRGYTEKTKRQVFLAFLRHQHEKLGSELVTA